MALLTRPLSLKRVYITFTLRRDNWIGKLIPRRCMVAAVGLTLAGLSIPLLMAIQLLPVTFLLGLVGLTLTAIGGVLTLVFLGEI